MLYLKIIRKIISNFNPNKIWTTYLVTKKFLDKQNLVGSYSTIFGNEICYYSGISIINSKKINSLKKISENFQILEDKRIAVNINTRKDYELLHKT